MTCSVRNGWWRSQKWRSRQQEGYTAHKEAFELPASFQKEGKEDSGDTVCFGRCVAWKLNGKVTMLCVKVVTLLACDVYFEPLQEAVEMTHGSCCCNLA